MARLNRQDSHLRRSGVWREDSLASAEGSTMRLSYPDVSRSLSGVRWKALLVSAEASTMRLSCSGVRRDVADVCLTGVLASIIIPSLWLRWITCPRVMPLPSPCMTGSRRKWSRAAPVSVSVPPRSPRTSAPTPPFTTWWWSVARRDQPRVQTVSLDQLMVRPELSSTPTNPVSHPPPMRVIWLGPVT